MPELLEFDLRLFGHTHSAAVIHGLMVTVHTIKLYGVVSYTTFEMLRLV